MKIVEIDGGYAQVEADGVRRRVGLALLPEAVVGDDVLIHAGYAISRLDPDEAEETRRLYQQIWEVEEQMKAEEPT